MGAELALPPKEHIDRAKGPFSSGTIPTCSEPCASPLTLRHLSTMCQLGRPGPWTQREVSALEVSTPCKQNFLRATTGSLTTSKFKTSQWLPNKNTCSSWLVMPDLQDTGPVTSLTWSSVTAMVEPHQPWGYLLLPDHSRLFLVPRHLHLWVPPPGMLLLSLPEPAKPTPPLPLTLSPKATACWKLSQGPECRHRSLQEATALGSHFFPPLTCRHYLLVATVFAGGRLG